MIDNFKEKLDKYAELAIKVGVNVKPGEDLVIRTPIECKDFVRLAVKHAYKVGAKNVYVEWKDEEVELLKYMMAPDEVFDTYSKWTAEKFTDIAKGGGAFLSVYAENPDLLKDVDPDKVQRAQKAAGPALKEWRSMMMTDEIKWNVISVPTEAWAKKVFPDLDTVDAVDKLWEYIFDCSRITDDPIAEWEKHNAYLKEKMDFLNESKFKYIRYKSKTADLETELPKNHKWASGSATDKKGNLFNPNIPTEEIYGMPHKFGVNGRVRSTKPLVFGGNTINDFEIVFEKGKIVDFSAEVGYDTLEKLISTDEGSHYLGELALVPHDSPISNKNTVFYNTLYDENASCHLAIGAAYKSCIVGGDEIPDEKLDEYGINDSIVHEDFMIGSADLDIVGVKEDGEVVELFRNGNWVF